MSKKLVFILIAIVIITGGAFLGFKALKAKIIKTSSQTLGVSVKSTDVNKEFEFPVKDSESDTIKIKYIIEKAEISPEIIVKGQKATAVNGRTFLIVDLKITNNFDKAISINTKDYIRLQVDGNDKELLAPDIHNDPVEVQAISTKYTRVGFPVNTTDHDFVLHIGEIQGDKQKINLNL